MNPEHKNKIRLSKLGKPRSPATKKKIAEGVHQYFVSHPETKQQISLAKLRFGELQRDNPIHFKHFRSLFQRASNCGTDLSNDLAGFQCFIQEVGLTPQLPSGERLSVGRKNHAKGYVKGNYFWQSLSDNSRESAIRIQPHKLISAEARKLVGDKLRGIPRSAEVRAKISKAQKGRVFTEEHRKKLSEAAKLRCA